MRFMRAYLLLSIAVLLAFSSVANAHTRALMIGAHSLEICAGSAYSKVMLGANGEKLPEMQDCDDCCIAVGLLQDFASQPARLRAANLTAWRGMELALNPGDAIFSIWPRGPPIKV